MDVQRVIDGIMREARVTISDSEFETIGIGELVSVCREAGLRDFEELVCRGTGAIVQVEVETPLDEHRLSALDSVDRWDRIGESSDGHLYVIAFTAPNLSEELTDEVADVIGTCNPVLSEQEVTMSFVGPQEVLSAIISTYESAGTSPSLEKLGPYKGREHPLDELTDRQREAIQTAYDMGYYEVPREVTTDEVATEVGVDPSTVAEHLQRAERNLLGHHL